MRADHLIAVPFVKGTAAHQRVLFAADPCGVILWQDPSTRQDVILGFWHRHDDIVVASFSIEEVPSR